MGLFDLLEKVGLGSYEEAPDENQAAPVASPSVAPVMGQGTSVRPLSQIASVTTEDVARIAKIDAGARELLMKALQDAHVGTVTDLGDTLDMLKDAIPDERTLYSKALGLLAKKGVSTPQVLSDYDKCLGVLEESSRHFEANQKAQQETRIGSKQKAIDASNATIQQKLAQMEALQQEVTALQTQAQIDQASIAGEQAKIAQVQERFAVVYRAIRGEVEAQRNKVTTYGAVS